jgi:hypothetical protein
MLGLEYFGSMDWGVCMRQIRPGLSCGKGAQDLEEDGKSICPQQT